MVKFDFSARKSKARQKLPVCNYTIYKISLQNICVCGEKESKREGEYIETVPILWSLSPPLNSSLLR